MNGRLQARLTAKAGKQLARQIGRIGLILKIFPTDMVVEDTSLRCPMDVRKRKVHPVTLNRPGNTAYKYHRAVLFLPFHDPNVGQGVIDDPISVVIPSIVEEDKIPRTNNRTLVKFAMLSDVMVDQPDAVGVRIR